jgi:hypothetical protein
VENGKFGGAEEFQFKVAGKIRDLVGDLVWTRELEIRCSLKEFGSAIVMLIVRGSFMYGVEYSGFKIKCHGH